MRPFAPSTAEELAQHLRKAADNAQPVTALGNNSKHLMGGPIATSAISVSSRGLTRILQYEPNDLTISVEAGLPFAALQTHLARRGQMVALDPPFSSEATIGGVIASNSSGPLRRGFGTARDLVIGMKFVTLAGESIGTGGMVVKNVAGLDVGKLLIGSFGTLGVVTSVNLRLHPLPEETRTFVFSHSDLDAAIKQRDSILGGVLQPVALDLVSPAVATRLARRGYLLAIQAHGSRSVLERYAGELSTAEQLTGSGETAFWQAIREFSPDFMRRNPGGVVVRISTLLSDIGPVFRAASGGCVSRAGTGVTYVHFTSWQSAAALWRAASAHEWGAAVEYAPDQIRETNELWLAPKADNNSFAIMKEVKQMFDPLNLLNRSRLYGRI